MSTVRPMQGSIRYRQGAVYLAAALAAGIAGGSAARAPVPVGLAAVAVSLAVALGLALARLARAAQAALLVSVAALGVYLAALSSAVPADSIARLVGAGGTRASTTYHFRGIMLERQLAGHAHGTSRYRVEMQSVAADSGWTRVSGFVLLDAPSRDIPYGRVIEATATFSLASPPSTWGQFDYRAYLKDNGIACLARVPQDGLIHILSIAPWHAVGRAIATLRNGLLDRMDQLSLNESGVIPAVLIGDISNLRQDTRDAFIRSGTMHLLAISGLHVAIVVGFFLALFRFAGVSRRRAGYATIALAVAYAALVGARPPVVRAAIMFSLLCLGMIVNRRTYVLSVISTTVFAMLVVEPRNVYNAGFQFSLAGVLGIIYLGAPLARACAALAEKARAPFMGVVTRIAQSVGYSVGAGIAVAPLTLYHFKILSLVSPLSNLVQIPITWAMIVSAMAAVGTSYVWAPIARFFTLSASGAETSLVVSSRVLSRLPGAYAYLPPPPAWLVWAAYGLIVGGALVAAATRRAAPILISGLVAVNIIILPILLPKREAPPQIVRLTDGRGAAVAAFDGRGGAALFLCGRGSALFASRILGPYFLERGFTHIDLVVEDANADVRMLDVLCEQLSVGRLVRQQRWLARGAANMPAGKAGTVGESSAGVPEVGPGDMIDVPGRMKITIHCGEPQDYLDPSQLYFKGMVAELSVRGRRAVLVFDGTDGCVAVAAKEISPGPDVLVVTSQSGKTDLFGQWITRLSPHATMDSSYDRGDYSRSAAATLGATVEIHPYVYEGP